ncbi:type II toxin-antitoxin system prevent-host-death family antitoxin [Marinactinospora rubrisoli]|uniref:Type II toxin-antitoxin system prevent-host-death family antitoxin n=1 Tax=Marinactinospora rubrisoli TaxID=2715399 RepID=A0ABW2KMX4_9ACTN
MTKKSVSVPSEEARARLGVLAARVHDEGVIVEVTVDGAPAGALVPLKTLIETGLQLAGVWKVSQARQQWVRVRREAARLGPQAIVRNGELVAVLVSAAHAHAVEHGLPVVEGDVCWDGRTMTVGGRPVAPGTYQVKGGGLLYVAPPQDEEEEL